MYNKLLTNLINRLNDYFFNTVLINIVSINYQVTLITLLKFFSFQITFL